jgi:hypothetical protein
MDRVRVLHSPADSKIWSTRCERASVVVRSGLPGREKISRKAQADEGSALKWAEREEWSRLKKGFTLVNPKARAGEPSMHFYLEPGYTGASGIAAVHDRLLFNLNLQLEGQPRSVAGPDEVLLINQDASVFQRIQLPQGQFASRTIFVPELGIVLLGDYYSVRVWTIETNELSLVEGTILSLTGSRAAFYVDPEIVVRDLVLQREVLRSSKDGGHTGLRSDGGSNLS